MHTRTALVLAAIGLLGGCAADTAGITTSAVDPKTGPVTASAKVDPACVTLMSQIDGLRKDGVTERVEKAAKGKSATINVKRASLAKMTELDKANAEFQAKCSTLAPRAAAAQAPAQSPVSGAVSNAVSSAAGNAAASATTKATKTAVAVATNKAAAVVAPDAPKMP